MSEILSFLAGFLLIFGIGLVIYCKIMLDIEVVLDDDEDDWLE
jgi:hypothetical protein|tara:strand:- start:48 stop:176 length:129 start_codon:yes stop_codon:yes gene_type:complete